jgi:hypothetical protein
LVPSVDIAKKLVEILTNCSYEDLETKQPKTGTEYQAYQHLLGKILIGFHAGILWPFLDQVVKPNENEQELDQWRESVSILIGGVRHLMATTPVYKKVAMEFTHDDPNLCIGVRYAETETEPNDDGDDEFYCDAMESMVRDMMLGIRPR